MHQFIALLLSALVVLASTAHATQQQPAFELRSLAGNHGGDDSSNGSRGW